MTRLARELDEKLRTLDPIRARKLESRVREVLASFERDAASGSPSDWPAGYFEQTAGALAGQTFERAPQGEMPGRDDC